MEAELRRSEENKASLQRDFDEIHKASMALETEHANTKVPYAIRSTLLFFVSEQGHSAILISIPPKPKPCFGEEKVGSLELCVELILTVEALQEPESYRHRPSAVVAAQS